MRRETVTFFRPAALDLRALQKPRELLQSGTRKSLQGVLGKKRGARGRRGEAIDRSPTRGRALDPQIIAERSARFQIGPLPAPTARRSKLASIKTPGRAVVITQCGGTGPRSERPL